MKYWINFETNVMEVFIPHKENNDKVQFWSLENGKAIRNNHRNKYSDINGYYWKLSLELPHNFPFKESYTYEELYDLIPPEVFL